MNRVALVAGILTVVMVTSVVTLPALGGGSAFVADGGSDLDGAERTPVPVSADLEQDFEPTETTAGSFEPVATGEPPTAPASLSQEQDDAVEDGVDEGIALAQAQGIEVSQEQRTAALEAATDSAEQHQDASAEQVQAATAGAVHGALLQEQRVEVAQLQIAVGGATDGALAQSQTASATQLQSATWGATHGALAQHQVATVDQLQVATRGAAAGAASEAGEREVDRVPVVQEAAQGAAYGVLEQYQSITVEQRQQVTLEHVESAAAGASAGAVEGSTPEALEQFQEIEVEQYQEVTIKQVQKAALGAAKGALVRQQTVTVEQTQAAAYGAGSGALIQAQSVTVEQVQRITVTQIQEASFGAAKGAIVQSQEATVEQIQAAALGGSQGALVQQQEVSIAQVQHAAFGASKGALESAIQYQVVEVEQIQAAAVGAGEGAVVQQQVVDVVQVQTLAAGASAGALSQHQEATVEQIQAAAKAVCEETARFVQYQRISVTQLQVLTLESAADAAAYAAEEETDDEAELVQYLEVEIEQRVEAIDDLEGEARLTFSDQESDGETVVVDSVELSEGGFVAIHDEGFVSGEPIESVVGISEYLEPGEHEDVGIELEESLEDDRELIAVAHLDTNENEAFDYVDSDGEEDVPYVGAGSVPVTDRALVALEEVPEATLQVDDQEGDGETLLVGSASAPVEFAITAEYDGERVESESFEGEETITEYELELEPPIEENATVDVAVVDEDGEALASETIEYALEEPDPDPTAELSVENQQGDGEALTVAAASADVEYALTVTDEDGEQRAETDPFDADETIENESIPLEPPLENDTELEVAVVDADDEVLASTSVEYAFDPGFEVEFVDCTRAEVTASLEDGDQVAASTGFYDAGGFGNTIIEDWVTIGEDVEAPFTGTIVFEVGAEDEVTDDEITVGIPEYGAFGTYISGISSPSAIPTATVDHPNPEAEACLEEVRPAEPSIFVDDIEAGEDAIDVTFGYENPNDAPLFVGSEFVEGTTDEEPPTELEPGEGEFTVEWTPDEDEERLVWEVDLSVYDYDEPLTAETPTAGELEPDEPEPATFAVSIAETNAPVEQGESLEVVADVSNVGGEESTQEVALAIDDTEVNSTTVSLEPDESETITLAADTGDLEPGEYTVTVSSEDEVAETTVVVEESAEPAFFAVTELSAPETGEPDEEVAVAATLENQGDETETQTVTYSVDGDLVAEESVELEGGESAEVTFTSPPLPEGESTHTVATDDDEVSATIVAEAPESVDEPIEEPADEPDEETTEEPPNGQDEPVEGPDEAQGEDEPTDESDEEQDGIAAEQNETAAPSGAVG
jgi:hypothetical protein